jgi:hypothetical protein
MAFWVVLQEAVVAVLVGVVVLPHCRQMWVEQVEMEPPRQFLA